MAKNRRFVLASRPKGAPTPENFRFETVETPVPGDGEVLIRNRFLSLDPYMRGRMSDAKSYATPVEIDAVMGGGTVGVVKASNNPRFSEGDLVLAQGGWQDFSLSDGRDLRKLPPELDHPSYALSILGMPGFTAWHGLLKIGEPKAGETVVVAAASGPVGSIVGQIARLKGAKVIGVAGGPKKCRTVVETFGFDACLDHKDPGFAEKLKQAVPDGIDVYYENVGGKVFDAVLPLLNVHARVPVCGLIASYNATGLPDGPDRLPLLAGILLRQRIRMQGFIISDHYAGEFADFERDMAGWVKAGEVKIIEDVVDGLENAPEAFMGLLEGKNFGKLVVRIGED